MFSFSDLLFYFLCLPAFFFCLLLSVHKLNWISLDLTEADFCQDFSLVSTFFFDMAALFLPSCLLFFLSLSLFLSFLPFSFIFCLSLILTEPAWSEILSFQLERWQKGERTTIGNYSFNLFFIKAKRLLEAKRDWGLNLGREKQVNSWSKNKTKSIFFKKYSRLLPLFRNREPINIGNQKLIFYSSLFFRFFYLETVTKNLIKFCLPSNDFRCWSGEKNSSRTRSYKKNFSMDLRWILLRWKFCKEISGQKFWSSKIQRNSTLKNFCRIGSRSSFSKIYNLWWWTINMATIN